MGGPEKTGIREVVDYKEGFYEKEIEDAEIYRWMSQKGRLSFEPQFEERFLEITVFSEFADLSQQLTVSSGRDKETLELVHGWVPLSFEVPSGADRLELGVE